MLNLLTNLGTETDNYLLMASTNRGRRPRGSKIRKTETPNLHVEASQAAAASPSKQLTSLRPNVILLLRHVSRNKEVAKPLGSISSVKIQPEIIGAGIANNDMNISNNLINPIDNFNGMEIDYNVKNSDEDLNKTLQKHNTKVRTGEVVNARCCFWDTQPFYTPPVHIPTRVSANEIETFGWFCSPECASAYIANQYSSNDNAHEHLTLLHHVYGPIYKNKTAFQRAPDPRQVLDCFGGAMTIEQYREIMKSGKQIQSLSTPLVKSVSEIHLVTPRTDILKPLRGKRQLVTKRIHT